MSTKVCTYMHDVVESIEVEDWGYVQLYGYSPKFVSAGLGCGLGWTTALSVTHSADKVACVACGAM